MDAFKNRLLDKNNEIKKLKQIISQKNKLIEAKDDNSTMEKEKDTSKNQKPYHQL